MADNAYPPGYSANARTGVHDMEWLSSVLPINGNSSYLLKLGQETMNNLGSWWSWVAIPSASFLAVCSGFTDAFGITWWVIFWLWGLDMFLGNLRALLSTKVIWSPSKNLDGVLKLITYAILGLTLHLLEVFISEISQGQTVIFGVLVSGGYAVCAINEVKSLFRHFSNIIPGFKRFGERVLHAVQNNDDR